MNGPVISDDKLIGSRIKYTYTSTGKLSSRITGYVSHRGLDIEKKMVDSDESNLIKRLTKQAELWSSEWDAKKRTKEAREKIEKMKNILKDTVEISEESIWEKLKDKTQFTLEKPQFKYEKPRVENCKPQPNFLDKLIKSWYRKKKKKQKENYKRLLNEWKELKKNYEKKLKLWQQKKASFNLNQAKKNKKIEQLKESFSEGKKRGVETFYNKALELLENPFNYQKRFLVKFLKEGILVLNYYLPDKEDIPKLKEVKFIKSRREIKKKYLSKRKLNKLYDLVIYQLSLAIVYRLFKYDSNEIVNTICFNGYINNLNKATGKRQNICVVSLQVKREEFMKLNLKNVDPKICFQKLKGVSAARISDLAPIPPILKLDTQDKRFITAKAVVKNVDDSTNIAAMNWEDFEHLVREVFETEFSQIGAEVKVTQSSRDKGVDAVAFDPDPIKGGKIIIQAKRYTNTVKVESVRALYGVMQDEGAMKGILVTTSDLGGDAYDFVKNKPITLISGSNLLNMLEKHGRKARINIKEAKKILKEREDNLI